MRKRLAIWLAGLAMVALPMTAMAMTSVSDSDLAGVTGQSGVSINIDVTANVTVGTLAWGDSDGMGPVAASSTYGGWVGLSGMAFQVAMHPRTDVPLEKLQFINIDVFTASNATGAAAFGSAVGTPTVRIGLPTAEINVTSFATSAFVAGSASGAVDPSVAATQQKLGNIYVGGLNVLLGQQTAGNLTTERWDAGYVNISAIAGATAASSDGVRINLQPKFGTITIGTLSWGNEGISGVYGDTLSGIVSDIAGQAAGYVGVRNLTINNLSIAGAMQISVGQSGIVNLATTQLARDKGVPATLSMKNAIVQILFENGFNVSVGNMTGSIVLSSNRDLVASAEAGIYSNTQELGQFYVGGLTMQIVDNAARTQSLYHGGAGGATTTYVIPAHPSVVQIVAH